jgi:phytoene dehydrogenase-like protein
VRLGDASGRRHHGRARQERGRADSQRGWSARDAEAWPGFVTSLGHVATVIGSLFARTPPDVDAPGSDDLWTLLRTLGAFRRLPKDEQWRLLRWGPMAVADLVGETFETELLRAAVAADGLLGAMLGPWSAGSGLQLLLNEANHHLSAVPDAEVVGGPAAVVRALERAARRHGVNLRVEAPVAHIIVEQDRVVGVALESGEVVRARAVISGLDPKRTFLSLCDAEHLPPEFLWRISHLRARGTLAKVHLALSATPRFGEALPSMLGGLVRIAPDLDYLERAFDAAKYGRTSDAPWIEFTLPSLHDTTMAPEGGHVLSAYVQYVGPPRRGGTGDAQRDAPAAPGSADEATALIDTTLRTLEQYAPGIRGLVVAAEAVTPSEMEAQWGLTGGHIFHGELSLDQAFTMRPLLGWGRYETPITGLFLCGSGTHPGTGLTGGSGANAARVILQKAR